MGEDVARDVEPRVARLLQVAVDQEGVVRVLVERGQRGARVVTQWISYRVPSIAFSAARTGACAASSACTASSTSARAGGSRGLPLRRQDRGLEPVGGEDLHELDEGEEGDGLGQVGVDPGVVGGADGIEVAVVVSATTGMRRRS